LSHPDKLETSGLNRLRRPRSAARTV